MDNRKPLPFSIDRNDARTLLAQVVDGLREAIVGGYYAPGDVLPTSRDLSRLLGVSMIVSAPALKRLADEGFVLARPRVGTVVRDRAAKQWRGHVVLAYPLGDDNYLQTILAGTLRDRLLEAGYLFTQAGARWTDGKYDFSNLDAALSRSVDLAITLYDSPEFFRHLARRNIPYAAFRETPEAPAGAVGFTHFAYNTAAGDFAAECVRLGVEEVVEVFWSKVMCDVAPALAGTGIRVTKKRIRIDTEDARLSTLKRAGIEIAAKIVRSADFKAGSSRRIYFFADDYIASGALLALADAGLKAPRDIRIATWANAGLGPVYVREVSRMEFDPAVAGETLATAAIKYLKTGVYPSGNGVGPKWIAGETLGERATHFTAGKMPTPQEPETKQQGDTP